MGGGDKFVFQETGVFRLLNPVQRRQILPSKKELLPSLVLMDAGKQ